MILKYRDIARYKYMVLKEFRYQTDIKGCACKTDCLELTNDGVLIFSFGFVWDGASGPTVDTPSSMIGSLVHDGIYKLIRLRLLETFWREYADQLLHDICTEQGMHPIRADIWKTMVETFAAGCARPGSEPEDEIHCVGKE